MELANSTPEGDVIDKSSLTIKSAAMSPQTYDLNGTIVKYFFEAYTYKYTEAGTGITKIRLNVGYQSYTNTLQKRVDAKNLAILATENTKVLLEANFLDHERAKLAIQTSATTITIIRLQFEWTLNG